MDYDSKDSVIRGTSLQPQPPPCPHARGRGGTAGTGTGAAGAADGTAHKYAKSIHCHLCARNRPPCLPACVNPAAHLHHRKCPNYGGPALSERECFSVQARAALNMPLDDERYKNPTRKEDPFVDANGEPTNEPPYGQINPTWPAYDAARTKVAEAARAEPVPRFCAETLFFSDRAALHWHHSHGPDPHSRAVLPQFL